MGWRSQHNRPLKPCAGQLRLRLNGVPAALTPRALAVQEAQRRELFAALRMPVITTSMSGQVIELQRRGHLAVRQSRAPVQPQHSRRAAVRARPERRDGPGDAQGHRRRRDRTHRRRRGQPHAC